jgi:transposase InsO family protein
MDDTRKPPTGERWAHLRFAIIGPLLAAPPAKGALREALLQLASREWTHPSTGKPTRFAFSTIERWYYQALRERRDPVGALRKKVRADRGRQRAMPAALQDALRAQHAAHPSWSVQLHHDNLVALVQQDPSLGKLPSYATLRRFMKLQALARRRRREGRPMTRGERRAAERLEQREVRSYEASHVHALWHLDFHHGSLPVLLPSGEWKRPLCLGILDDRSRLACHVQWYLAEGARELVHGLCQAFQKRGLPRSILTDNGAAMTADETRSGLLRLSIIHATTLPASAYQNGKQETWWAQVEGRLLAMLEGVSDLTLDALNEATQAWVELEYHRRIHSELRATPLQCLLEGPDVSRESPGSETLRLAFTVEVTRAQRKSDGTLTLHGRRFEVASRFRHLTRLALRYARWDLSRVLVVDERTGAVLDRLYPLDKQRNADGARRRLEPPSDAAAPAPEPGGSPLLKKLLAEYSATGLPPAYVPLSSDTDSEEEP